MLGVPLRHGTPPPVGWLGRWSLVADGVRAAAAQRKVYDDSDGQRKDEIASMAGGNAFAGFYDRVKELKEYHRRHPNSGFTEKEDLSYMISEQPWVDFTGEVRSPTAHPTPCGAGSVGWSSLPRSSG